MRNLIHTAAITEGKAANMIFDACRANERREAKLNVSFRRFASGNEWEAALRDADGVVIAIATVDSDDC